MLCTGISWMQNAVMVDVITTNQNTLIVVIVQNVNVKVFNNFIFFLKIIV